MHAANSTLPESSPTDRFDIAPGVRTERFRAEELDVHPATLARARNRRQLGFLRIGDKVYYSREHVEEWLERNENPASPSIKAGSE